MNECKWCHNRSKKLIVDSEGVCQACRIAARYRDRPMDEGYLIGEDRNGYMPSGGRRTKPVWTYDDVREDE